MYKHGMARVINISNKLLQLRKAYGLDNQQTRNSQLFYKIKNVLPSADRKKVIFGERVSSM